MFIEIVCYSLSGFFMKLSDEFIDKKNNYLFSIITGIICGLVTLYISVINANAACVFLSIVISNLLAHKIDSINHILTAILFIVLLYILNIPTISILCLVLCTISGFIDEWGNDKADLKKEKGNISQASNLNKIKYFFFEYRFSLKITVLILSLGGLIQILNVNFLNGLMLFEPLTVVYVVLFDTFYEIANLVFNRFYNIF